jgi:Flp pilus assembly protein TadD/ADP-heptose:LPS heptosyltransferase
MDNFELAKEYFLDGCSFLEAEDFSRAEHKFIKSLDLLPDRASTLTNLSAAQIKLRKYSEARAAAQKAISVESNNSEAYLNLGVIETELKNFDTAAKFFDKALSLKPNYHMAWYNKGNMLHELKRYDEAIAHYDKALVIKPDFPEAWSNKGLSLSELKRYDEAIAHYDKAIDFDASFFDAYWNKSSAQLTIGDFIEGWKNYEYRWKRKDAEFYKHSSIPLLQNINDIFSKKILVWCDQYYGDSIQFSRYINLLTSMEAKVLFEVKDPLKEIFKNSFQGSLIISPNDLIPEVDYQISTSSLPLLYRTTLHDIPKSSAYLKPSSQVSCDWKKILNLNGNRLNIALACSGNTLHYKNDNRPIKLKLFEPLLDIANIFLVQKEIEETDRAFLDAHPEIRFLGNEIQTFNDTAAIIEKMDLTISIDTSVAHLSGALGKTTWLLASWASDWRWLLDREDSPWYPSMKIYRQPVIGDWRSVLDRVKLDLGSSLS